VARLTYKELIKILKKEGCVFVRQAKGSHEIWHSPITNKNFTVPTTLKGEGTLRNILKSSGVQIKAN